MMNNQRPRMRLALTADLHYGITDSATITALVEKIIAAECDLVVIAGDIGEPETNFRDALELFERLPVPRAVVAGNHDLWAGDYPSRYLFDDVLPHLTRQCGCTWLEHENLVINRIGICGTIGWYDYSAKDPRLTGYNDERYAREKGKYNYDAMRIDWPTSDRDFAAEVLTKFRSRISRLQTDADIDQIIVVTHVPPFAEQIVRKPQNDFLWNVNNAYFGNLTLGQEILRYDKVRLVVSGHTHYEIDTQINCPRQTNRSIRALTIGSQYYHPQVCFIDLSR